MNPDPFSHPTNLVQVQKVGDFRIGKANNHESYSLWRGNKLIACGGRALMTGALEIQLATPAVRSRPRPTKTP